MVTQQEAIDAIRGSTYACLVGPAGSGKTTLINQIKTDNTMIVTPTGISALTAGGQTAHSAFQLPFGLPTDKDREKITPSMHSLFNGKVDRIIFDEAFMPRAIDVDTIDYKLRKIRGNSQPFGGIPMLFVGDPFQIEPVVKYNEKKHLRRMKYKSQFIFDSKVWEEMNPTIIKLTKIYRQEDPAQAELLNALRTKNKYWKHAIRRLNQWAEENVVTEPLHLCAYKADAQVINDKYYKENINKEYIFRGQKKDKFKTSDLIVDETIYLKKGLKIIMCANDHDAGYLNGEIGYVCEVNEDEIWVQLEGRDYPIQVEKYKWESYKYSRLMGSLTKVVTGSFEQYPIKQANAITCHKSQSQTLDNVVVDLGKGAFSAGLAYVALSRVRSLRNLGLARLLTEEDIIVHPRVVEWYESIGD